MDLVWNVVDAGAPLAIDIDREVSDKYDPNICPVKLKAIFDHPGNSWRGPIQLVWYQGGLKPENPRGYVDVSRVGNGAIFEGTKGSIFADFTSRIILPNNDDGDFTYYKRRSKDQLEELVAGVGMPTQAAPQRPPGGGPRRQPELPKGFTAWPNAQPKPGGFPDIQFLEGNVPAALGLPNSAVAQIKEARASGQPMRRPDPFQVEWINACKGLNNDKKYATSRKTHCDFDYSGTMMEQMLLGLVAHQAGKRLEYDPATGRVTNAPEANAWLKRTYRANWTLNG
jgi:hypothetical protein